MTNFINNNLTASRFTLTISGSEFVDFTGNIQEFIMPNVKVSPISFSTPTMNIPEPGTKLEYEPLTTSVLLDNKLSIYSTLYNWLLNSVNDDNNLIIKRDLIVTVYDLNEVPTKQIVFIDGFPVGLSSWSWVTTDANDINLKLTVTFNYTNFQIRDI